MGQEFKIIILSICLYEVSNLSFIVTNKQTNKQTNLLSVSVVYIIPTASIVLFIESCSIIIQARWRLC